MTELDRRRFLGGLLALGAGLALGCVTLPPETATERAERRRRYREHLRRRRWERRCCCPERRRHR